MSDKFSFESINEKNIHGIRELKHLRNENLHRFVSGHININSMKNKFESLVEYVGNNLDILKISETKIDDTFPDSQFLIESFSISYRLYRTAKGEEILILPYIRQDILSKYLKKTTVSESFEGLFVELNLRSKNGFSDAHIALITKK